ncbi:hypothetical protein JVU11DRAFT_1290 [Chiua virens]|nr:hypothetical protein JVU11DRAFT_1290 [Chiua virens]
MSFLDDYQVPYKIIGVRLVSGMLTRVPPDLLLQTGVDTLIFTSLTNSLSHLGDKSTPDLIRSAVTTTLQLIDLTTPSMYPTYGFPLHDHEVQGTPATMLTHILSASQSKSLSIRFSRLSTLLSSSLLGTVIMYTPAFLPPTPSGPDSDPFTDPEHEDTDSNSIPEFTSHVSTRHRRSLNPTLVAVAQSLPHVLTALGIGGARFLKGVIPVLAEWLGMPLLVVPTETGSISEEDASPYDTGMPSSHDSEALVVDVTLHLASLSSLSVLLHTCSPRIGGWSTTIVDALGRCWVGCLDVEKETRCHTILKDSVCVLKQQLKETVIQLSKACSDVIENEYSLLLAFNKTVFEELVGKI